MNTLTLCLSSLLLLATCFTASTSGYGFRVVSTKLVCEEEGSFVLHEDCTKYYVCSNGEPVLSECPETLYFDPDVGYCNFPDEVEDCIGGTRDPGNPVTNPTVPPQPTTPEPQPTTTAEPPVPTTPEPPASTTAEPPAPSTPEPPVPTTAAPEPTTPPPQPETTTSAPGVCPPEGIDYIPFPGDCQKYYLCADGQETEMSCADGTLFDPDLKKCNLAEEVKCGVTTPPPNPPTTPAPFTCPVDGIDSFPDPSDCQKYFLCVNGEAHSQTCADGLLFDPETKQCRVASEVECNVGPKCPSEGISYIPVEGSCTKYTMCVNGQGLAKECAAGTEFNPETQECVLDANYDCPLNFKISAFAFLSRFFH